MRLRINNGVRLAKTKCELEIAMKNTYIMKKIIVVCFVLSLFTCQKGTKTTDQSKKKVAKIEIKGQQILKEHFEIQQIYVVDSLLVVKNNNTTERLFSVFNRKGEFLTGFGRIGQGPDDFESQTAYSKQISYNKSGDICIWLYELNYQRLRLVNLSKTIVSKSAVIEKTITIPSSLNFMNPYCIDSTLIVGNVINLDMKMDKLRFYNPISKETVKRVPLLPNVETDKKDMTTIQYDYNSLFVNFLNYQPNRGFVTALCAINRMDFMNLKGEITKTVSDNSLDDKNTYKLSHFPKDSERIVYNCHMTTTANYVLTLYNGINNDENLDFKNNVIRVFDWNGKEKLCLKPSEPLMFIAFDEVNDVLYGVTEDYDVFKYKLENIFKEI